MAAEKGESSSARGELALFFFFVCPEGFGGECPCGECMGRGLGRVGAVGISARMVYGGFLRENFEILDGFRCVMEGFWK